MRDRTNANPPKRESAVPVLRVPKRSLQKLAEFLPATPHLRETSLGPASLRRAAAEEAFRDTGKPLRTFPATRSASFGRGRPLPREPARVRSCGEVRAKHRAPSNNSYR